MIVLPPRGRQGRFCPWFSHPFSKMPNKSVRIFFYWLNMGPNMGPNVGPNMNAGNP